MNDLVKSNNQELQKLQELGFGAEIDDSSRAMLKIIKEGSVGFDNMIHKDGDILNTSTLEVTSMGEWLDFAPLGTLTKWVEWQGNVREDSRVVGVYNESDTLVQDIIRDNGGTPIPKLDKQNKAIPFYTPNDNQIVKTHYMGIAAIENDAITWCATISFSKGRFTAFSSFYKNLSNACKKDSLPIYSVKCRLTSDVAYSSRNEKFFIYKFAPADISYRNSIIKDNPALLEELKDAKTQFDNATLNFEE